MNGSSNTGKRQGTGFVNLQQMIGANRGNQLGSAIQQGVGNRVGQIQSDLEKQKQGFQTELGKSRLQDTDKESARETLSMATNTPQQLSNERVSKFQDLFSGQYKGPSGLANTAAVDAQARELGQYGANIGSAAGRTGLLQRYVGGPKYTQGQQRVDNLLLGQTGGGALKNIRKQAMGLESAVSGEKQKAQMEAGQAKQERQLFGKELESQIGRYDDPSTPEDESTGAIGNLYKDVMGRTSAFNEAQKNAYDAVKDIGGTDTLTQAQLEALGLTEGQKLYDLNLGQFIRQNPGQVGAQQVASAEDYAKYAALNRLAGRTGAFLTDPSMAGTAKEAQLFDKEGFMGALGAKEADVNTARTNLNNLEAELAYRSQYTNNARDAARRVYGSTVDNMDQYQLAQMIRDNSALSMLFNPNKVVEDAGAISQYRDLVNNARNIYNTYNPERVLRLMQNKQDGQMTSGDPLAGGGGKGSWGGGQ